MKAAAARRARGRQAESTKKGGGERERVVERHRVSVLINCIGRLYDFHQISSRSRVCWREIWLKKKKLKTFNMWCAVFRWPIHCHFSTTTVSLFVSSLPALWLAPSIPHPSSFFYPLSLSLFRSASLARSPSHTHTLHAHAQVVISRFPLLSSAVPTSLICRLRHMEAVWRQSPRPIRPLKQKKPILFHSFNELIR